MLVFHVDDDPDIQDITRIALETVGGLEVVQASSGAEALLRVSGLNPDVALLDVMMPEMTGPELMQALRRMDEFRDLPVIFMTARAQTSEIADLRAQGAIGVLTKPFDPMSLASDIQAILRAARTRS